MRKILLPIVLFLAVLSLSAQDDVYPADMEKNVLIEIFTSQQCTTCPIGISSIDKAIANTGIKASKIEHHTGFLTDYYSMIEDSVMMDLYGDYAHSTPSGTFDRMLFPGGMEPTVDIISFSDDENHLRLAAQEKPYVSLNLTSTYNSKTRLVTLKAEVYTHEQLPEGDNRISVWLTQDGIVGYQKGASNSKSYTHNAISRGTLTDVWGDKIDFPVGQVVTKELSFVLPETIEATYYEKDVQDKYIATVPKNMKLVVFVNQAGDTVHDYKVFNGTEVTLGNSYKMGGFPDDIPSVIDATTTSRPASGNIYNIAGQRVLPGYKGIIISNGRKLAQ